MIQQTRIEREMLANTTAQLDDDVLSYEWLHALAKHHHPNGNSRQHCELVRRTLQELIASGGIVIGTASSGGTIRPWPEAEAELLKRVDVEITKVGMPTTEAERFCFWIGLPSTVAE